MADPVATTEPLEFVSGDTVQWSRSFPDYPASDGWTLKYAFRGVGTLDVQATPDGDDYAIAIGAAASAIPAGLYQWVAYVEQGDPVERHTVAMGRIVVSPSLLTATPTQLQQHAERALPLIEAQIEELLANAVEAQTIEQTTLQRRKLEDLYTLRNRYKGELSRLKHRGRLPRIEVSFGRR